MEFTARQIVVLRAFYNQSRTVQEVAEELDISYEVCVKEVRTLVRNGALQEMAFREGKKRKLTTVELPPSLAQLASDRVMMVWGNKLQHISAALLSIAPTPDKSIRFKVMQILMALERRGMNLAEQDDSGWNAKDIRMAMRKIQSEVRTWENFIDQLLKLPIWYDDPKAQEKIGTGASDELRNSAALEAERHFMSSGKRALEE